MLPKAEDIKLYCNFLPGKAYILTIIPRKKENGKNTEKDKLGLLQRRIVRSDQDVDDALEYFKDFTSRFPEIVFRLYGTVNRRCLTKGLFSIQEKIQLMIKDLHYGNEEVHDRTAKLSSTLKSCLAEKSCRDTKYFHYDVDFDNKSDDGELQFCRFCSKLLEHTQILWSCNTLNGFAIITNPFNPHLVELPKNVELKHDSYLYYGVYNYKGK